MQVLRVGDIRAGEFWLLFCYCHGMLMGWAGRYLVPGVGNIAINDSFMLESSIYFLLKKYLRSDPAYIDYVELFLEVCSFVSFDFRTFAYCSFRLLSKPSSDNWLIYSPLPRRTSISTVSRLKSMYEDNKEGVDVC